MQRKKLSDILNGGGNGGNWINGNWGDIPAAPDFAPIPPGKYIAHLKSLEPFQAKTGTPGIKLTFEIIEGEYKGRRCWYDVWLTDAAKGQAIRDLGKLGIHDRAKLEGPIPRWIRCAVHLVKRTGEQGDEFNRVKSYDVLGIDAPEADPFAPTDEAKGGPAQ